MSKAMSYEQNKAFPSVTRVFVRAIDRDAMIHLIPSEPLRSIIQLQWRQQTALLTPPGDLLCNSCFVDSTQKQRGVGVGNLPGR